jgi:preprotein translocase subunit SecG
MLYTTLIVLHVLLAAGLIAIVLIQRGPGATMGAAFGAGASGTVFGSRGSAGFLGKLTTWMGVGFFLISLSMAVLVARTGGTGATIDDLGVFETRAPATAPVTDIDLDRLDDATDDADLEFLPLPDERAGADDDDEILEPPPR